MVENKAGAGGMLGMDVVAKAAPDGHTLGIGFNGPIAFGPFMYKKMPYDPGKDLLPIVLTTSQPNVLAVPANQPGQDAARVRGLGQNAGRQAELRLGGQRQLVAPVDGAVQGRRRPRRACTCLTPGSPPAATSLAAGDTQMLFAVAPALLPLVQGGKHQVPGRHQPAARRVAEGRAHRGRSKAYPASRRWRGTASSRRRARRPRWSRASTPT